jgi:hypothetical protein
MTEQWGQPAHANQPAPGKPRWQKRHLIGYPLVAIVAVGIGASGSSSDETPTSIRDAAAASEEPAPAAQVATTHPAPAKTRAPAATAAAAVKSGPGIGDRVRDGKFQFTVTKVTGGTSVGDSFLGTKAQGRFVFVHLTVENIGDEAQTLYGDAQTLYDAKGRKFESDSEAAIYLQNSNSLWEEINPGNKVKGIVVFDLPKSARAAKLELHDSAFSGGVDVSLK